MRMYQSEYYQMYKVEQDLWWYKGLRDVLGYFIPKLITKDSHILDAGCGTGITIQFLQEKGYEVSGFDYSDDAVKLCKERGLKHVTVGSVTDIKYSRETFDGIINMDVLGILNNSDQRKAISEFQRVLKPGGYLFLHCAALEFLRSQHDDVTSLRHRFTKSELKKMFSKKEWDIYFVSYRVFLLFVPIAVVKLIKQFLKIFTKKSKTDITLPAAPLNALFYTIQKFENYLLRYISLPIGTSVFLIAQKK